MATKPKPVPTGLPADLIGLAEAASLLPGIRPGKRMSIAAIYRWCRIGRLPAWKIGRHSWVSRADVLAMMKPASVREAPIPAHLRTEPHCAAVAHLASLGMSVG